MRIAVTGASGFIGVPLCRQLVRAGYAVRAFVRAPAAELTQLPQCEQLVVDDLERYSGWPQGLNGVAAIVHLAAHAHGRAAVGSLDRLNVDATLAAARAARDVGAKFVFISSVKVHGESALAPLREESPVAPVDAYALSKARAEEALHALSGLPLTVLRPPLVYGPRVRANFLALLRAVARGVPLPLASVNNRRSMIYVGNLVDAIVKCLASAGTFLLSDGPSISTANLCRELGIALDRPARLFRFPAALLPLKLSGTLEVDDSAIRHALSWQPPFTREQGLKATADWYLGR